MPNQGSKLPLPYTDFSRTKFENLNWIWCVVLSVAGRPHVLVKKKQMQLLLTRSLYGRRNSASIFFVSFLSVNWQRIRNKRTTEEKIRPQQQRQQAIADEHWTNATMFQLNTNKNAVDEYVTRCYLLTVRHWDNWIQTRIERFEHE